MPTILIIENGIEVYKYHFCHCGCGRRIRYNERDNYFGIPKFISGHNTGQKYQTTNESDKVYPKLGKIIRICLICKRRFRSITGKHLSKHKLTLNEYVEKYNLNKEDIRTKKEVLQAKRSVTIMRDANLKAGKNGTHWAQLRAKEGTLWLQGEEHKKLRAKAWTENNPMHNVETKKKYDKVMKKLIDEGKVGFQTEKFKQQHKEWIKNHPEEIVKWVNRMNEGCKNNNTSIEIILQKFIYKLKINFFVHKWIPNKIRVIIPDILIPSNKIIIKSTVIFADGCYWHGCLKCYPKNKNSDKVNRFHKYIRKYDKINNEILKRLGLNVIRIWEHEIDDGSYKSKINKVLS